MPTLNPQTVFPFRQAIDSGEIIASGANWFEEYRYSSDNNNEGRVQTEQVFYMEPSELSAIDPAVHNSAAAGIKKTLFSFGSGIDFCVSVYVTTETSGQTTVESVCAAGCILYNNSYTYTMNGLSMAGGIGWSQAYAYCPVNLAKMFGIKFTVKTNYMYGLGKAIEGETKAAYFDIDAFIPWSWSDTPSSFQSWAHISSDSLYFTSRMDDPDQSDWVYNPQYMYFGYAYGGGTGWGQVLRTDNLETFYNALKTINPYIQDPFKIIDPNDPTQEEDPSTPGGGGGNQDKGSDPVDFPGLPVGGPLSTGAIKAFEVSPAAITQMFMKLWDTSIFDVSTFQKLVQEPLDALISLQCVPIDPHNSGSSPSIKLGNFDTEATAPLIDQQYYSIDCGQLTVQEYWGSALDYSPYTKLQIFLPFIGIRDLDVDECMGKTLHVKYNYDILTGNLTAQIKVGASVLYKFPGNVKQDVPVTSQVNTAMEVFAHGLSNMAGAAIMGSGGALAAATISTAVNVALAKTKINRSGDLNGSTGLLDDFNCYLIIQRPIQSLANNFKGFKGYPSNMSRVLNTLTGYTEVEYIHLTGISGATDTELDEIEALLKKGVII